MAIIAAVIEPLPHNTMRMGGADGPEKCHEMDAGKGLHGCFTAYSSHGPYKTDDIMI